MRRSFRETVEHEDPAMHGPGTTLRAGVDELIQDRANPPGQSSASSTEKPAR